MGATDWMHDWIANTGTHHAPVQHPHRLRRWDDPRPVREDGIRPVEQRRIDKGTARLVRQWSLGSLNR